MFLIMKNLFERLIPEMVDAIERESEKYPASMGALKELLKNEYFFTYLTMSDAYRLLSMSNLKTFGILELSSLFEQETNH